MAGVTAPLLGLQKRSLREQALAALRTAITSGELEPGRHLVETELSDMLQISRGTLREALRHVGDGAAGIDPPQRASFPPESLQRLEETRCDRWIVERAMKRAVEVKGEDSARRGR